MRKQFNFLLLLLLALTTMKAQNYTPLTEEEKNVILYKGTEQPFAGKYTTSFEQGEYVCKQCKTVLFHSSDKFHSTCGWPSFDDEIEGAIEKIPDEDGMRTEIVCANCKGHLGHVFLNEGFTKKNVRHCVNSISLEFVPSVAQSTQTAIFASGCFWGTEYHMQKQDGVISTEVGYTGGEKKNPTYIEVCSGTTGHAEAVKVVFDPSKVSYEALVKLFFETHDQSQINRQGPDIGTQYRSEIFYVDESQRETAVELVSQLEKKGHTVATKLSPAPHFYTANEYHQQYYMKSGQTPYCHIYTSKF